MTVELTNAQLWFFVHMQANYGGGGGGDMSRRQPNYGPGPGPAPGPAPGYQYQMQGPGYQAVPYGSGGYGFPGTDQYDVNSGSYPTPVWRIFCYL